VQVQVADDDPRARPRARLLAVDLAHEVLHVQREREDLDALAGDARRRPLLARAVGVQLDPVVVGVAQVDRLRDAVIGRALDPRLRARQSLDRARELAARLERQRVVIQAGVAPACSTRTRRSSPPAPMVAT